VQREQINNVNLNHKYKQINKKSVKVTKKK